MTTTIDVRDAVIGALAAAYPGVSIYAEEIKQGLVEPCFFVKDLPVNHSRIMGRRYSRQHTFDIHYFPSSSSDPNSEAHGVGEVLFGVLEYIPCSSGSVRGSGMRYEIVDSVLHFFLTIDLHVIKQITPAPLMATAELNGGIT